MVQVCLQGEELGCTAIHLTSFLKKMLGGALIPGKPVANMYFTMYGYNPVVQALNLLRDLKLVSFAVILSRSYC